MSVARADLFFAGVSPAMSEKTDVVSHFLADWLNFVDPPRHTSLRKLQTPAFSARKIAALEPYIQQVVDTVLDALAGAGQFDLIRDFSFPCPCSGHRAHARSAAGGPRIVQGLDR
jgi:cytochrome P450